MRAVVFFLVAFMPAIILYSCTIQVDVPRPNITLECVVVELPGGTQVRDCDAGAKEEEDSSDSSSVAADDDSGDDLETTD